MKSRVLERRPADPEAAEKPAGPAAKAGSQSRSGKGVQQREMAIEERWQWKKMATEKKRVIEGNGNGENRRKKMACNQRKTCGSLADELAKEEYTTIKNLVGVKKGDNSDLKNTAITTNEI